MKVYLDNCCYNRPYDDLIQDRIRLESEAVLTILRLAETGLWDILGSDILEVEMHKLKDKRKLEKVTLLYHVVNHKIAYSNEIKELSLKLQSNTNIKLYDSLHLASAIIGKADVFLTTDDKLIKICKRSSIDIQVENPVIWFMEVEYD